MKQFVRLRQVCLAVSELAPAVDGLSRVLGIEVCFRSPTIARFGLENAVLALNGSFIEILAPLAQNGHQLTRFLDRGNFRGAYLLAFDSRDLDIHRRAAIAAGVRTIEDTQIGIARVLQFHPRDTGAAILEIDHHTGGDDRFGSFEWGGEHWQAKVRTDVARDLLGCCITGSSAHATLQKWAVLLGLDAPGANAAHQLNLDHGTLKSRLTDDVDRVDQIHLSVVDPGAVLQSARDRGWPIKDNGFLAMGVWFKLFDAHAGVV